MRNTIFQILCTFIYCIINTIHSWIWYQQGLIGKKNQYLYLDPVYTHSISIVSVKY